MVQHAYLRDIAKADENARTVYFIAGLAGHILRFRPLAKCLTTRWRLRGMHYPIFVGESPYIKSIPELAGQMAPALATVEGPVVIVGYSIGGNVAYEIAASLRAEGRAVAVVLIDTFARRLLARHRRSRPFWEKLLRRYGRAFNRILVQWPRICLKAIGVERKKPPQWVPKEKEVIAFFNASVRAVRAYMPPETDVPVVLVRAVLRTQPAWLRRIYWRDADLGWGMVAPLVAIVPSPGNHLTIAEPENATVLASDLDRAIEIAFAHLQSRDTTGAA